MKHSTLSAQKDGIVRQKISQIEYLIESITKKPETTRTQPGTGHIIDRKG